MAKQASLTSTKVLRGGVTSPYMSNETSKVSIEPDDEFVRLSFVISSKGGGNTQVYLNIGKADFRIIAEKMAVADRQATLEAMSSIIVDEIKKQPEKDDENKKRARVEVKVLAAKRYNAAPSDNDDLERIISEGTRKLVEELNESGSASKAA